MANLTIKDIPEDVHEALREAARAEHRSLNSYIVDLLRLSAGEHARRRAMRESRAAFGEFQAGLRRLNDSTALLHEDRDR